MVSIVVPNLILTAFLVAVPIFGSDYFAWQMSLFLLYGIAAQGIGLAWGKGGFLPLGNAVFFGVAAYGSAMILKLTSGAIMLNLVVILAIAICLGAVAWGLAAIIFRGSTDSGPFFSLITLALVLIVEQLAETNSELTGGFNGYGGFPSIGGLDPFGSLYYLIAGLALLVSIGLLVLDRLPAGLVLKGVVSQEARLQALGFATNRVKAWAFAGSAFITALAGALFASQQGIVTPPTSGFKLSAELVIWAAVGGRFHPLGPLFGAVAIGLLSTALRDTYPWWEVLVATIFLLVVLFARGGAAEMVRKVGKRLGVEGLSAAARPQAAPVSRGAARRGPLSLSDVHLSAGSVHILQGLSFACHDEGILCVIGPNGAGKTTMLKAVTGAMPVQKGKVTLGETDITNASPSRALQVGIGRKFQIPTVFSDLSVQDNLRIANMAARARALDFLKPSTLGWTTQSLERLLATPGVPLAFRLDDLAGSLPQGHRQVLELALTIAAQPHILLLDEPTAGMSPEETSLMVRLIQDYQSSEGAFVLIIEHDMALVEALEASVLVMHQGRTLAEGSLREVRSNPAVNAVYAGGHK